jgi:uncharacterized phage-associated protein
MITALEAAKYLIQLAASEPDEAEPMTHMRVQKLLYYAQGWHLGLFGKPLFAEPLQAWKNGPVVPTVYETIKAVVGDVPARPLTPTDLGASSVQGRNRVFIETVWKRYAGVSAAGLKERSHAEPPWAEARGGVPDGGHCETEITTDSLRRYFGSQQEAVLPNLGDLEAVYEAEAVAREQPSVPFAELRRRRRERA